MTITTALTPGAYRPAPIALRLRAAYRGRCTRCGNWWRPEADIAKTTAGQYICPTCTPLAEVPAR